MDQPLLFFYDYVDPGSYLVDLLLRKVVSDTGLVVEYRPLELRAPPDPLLHPGDDGWAERWRGMEEVATSLGVELNPSPVIPWTRKAHELALFGAESGCFLHLHAALFRAHLVEGRDIGRVDVLVEIAGEVGLDPGQAKVKLDVDRHLGTLLGAREEAVALGVSDVPTLWLNERRLEGYHDEVAIRAFASQDT